LNSEIIWNIWKISVIITPKESSSSSSLPPTPAAAAYIHVYPRAVAAAVAAVMSLKFYPKHATNKTKTKHIMKISHINVRIYGNYGRKVI
jgi:hypothetical protein